MGAKKVDVIFLNERADANLASAVAPIKGATGIFMTGGDQRRLMGLLWETEAARAMHLSFHLRGCCIGGTSAGAAGRRIL